MVLWGMQNSSKGKYEWKFWFKSKGVMSKCFLIQMDLPTQGMEQCVELQEISYNTATFSLSQQNSLKVHGFKRWGFVTTPINDNINPDLCHLTNV